MSLGKKFLSVFVETNENENDEKKQASTQKLDPTKPIKPQLSTQSAAIPTINTPLPYNNTPIDSVSYMPTSSMEDLNNFRQHFKELLEQHNLPGLDYYEFIQAKNNMPLPVEAQRYQVAFAAQKAAGLTKDVLLTTADKYLEIVKAELNDFTTAFSTKFQEDVESKKTIIDQKKQQMIDLSQQINALNEEIKKMEDETQQNELTLNNKKVTFEQAANEVIQTIEMEKKKITDFIQEA